mmetsp:Transcript_24348/g.47883  ORF Transcript_24348/g.47883 Transcript_24348/m.47883 type:complete len:96 (+) Transcript_24348:1088-1375(+)
MSEGTNTILQQHLPGEVNIVRSNQSTLKELINNMRSSASQGRPARGGIFNFPSCTHFQTFCLRPSCQFIASCQLFKERRSLMAVTVAPSPVFKLI